MDAPTVRYATTRDGVRIAYGVVGEGEPLLYCHCPVGPPFANVVPIAELDDWFGELSRRFQLIVFDFRGGGLSDRGELPLTFETLSLDIEAVLDDLEFESAHLQSELMSCAPAIEFATEHPERVRRMVMWHPMVAQSQRSVDRKLWERWDHFFDTAQQDWEMFCVRLISESYDVSGATTRAIANAWTRHADPLDFGEAWDPRGTETVEPLLQRIQAPTLVLQRGGDGYYRTTLDGAVVAAKIPDAALRIVPGHDNFPYTDEPLVILAAVEDFLRAAPNRVAAAATKELPADLSPREVEVAQEVAGGLSNGEIATRLGVQPSTVARHIHNALTKTGLANRTELAVYVVRHGLSMAPD